MKLVTIDTDKLNWMKITGGSLGWVNEVDLVNAIITPKELRDAAIKIDAAYEDGYEHGYEQARLDYERLKGEWINQWTDGFGNRKGHCNTCGCIGDVLNNFCPNCGADMQQSIDKD